MNRPLALIALLTLSTTSALAADLTIASGVVVKFGSDAELVSRDTLRTEGEVVFTSINDASVGGTTVSGAPAPQPGDWKGITLAPGALVADTRLDQAEIRYAGGGGNAGLSLSRLNYTLADLRLWRNLVGIRASGGGTAVIDESRILENGVGVLAEAGATPRIERSEISGNTIFGAENRAPASVALARGNWWGHPSGPQDPLANPAGQGNAVSAGVDYGQFLDGPPLVRCSVRAANNVYTVIRRDISLALACRNAIEFRLSESTEFTGPFSPLATIANFRLSPSPGSKTIYAQFRGEAGQTRVVSTPQPFVYNPTTPLVTFQAPAANAVLTENTTIRVTATDPIGVTGVEFRANSTVLGTDSEAPYEWLWEVSSFADGPYTLTAIATNSDERTGQSTRAIRLERIDPQPDSYTFNEGEVLFVDAPGVLANDQAVASGVIIDVMQQPAWGTLNVTNDGAFVFRPDTPDRNGTTTFRYRLRLGSVVSQAVTVTLNVTSVNDPPVTQVDRFLTDENVSLDVPAPGVLENDSDIDSATLSVALLVPPNQGSLLLRPNGSLTYVPDINFRGDVEFVYEAIDGSGGRSQATAIIAVTQPPTATNDVYLLDMDQTLTVDEFAAGLVGNDLDQPEYPEVGELTTILVSSPANGTLQLDPDGTFVYQPNSGFQGLDPFAYKVTDGLSESNDATVTLAVGVTGLPRAFNDAYQGTEDQELIVNAANGVLSNDTDGDTPRGDLEVFLVNYDRSRVPPEPSPFPQRDRITLNPDGSFSVRPGPNFNGPTWFTYEIYDGTSASNVGRVDLDIQLVNDGVVAEDDTYGTRQNQLLAVPSPGRAPIRENDRYDDDFPVAFETVGTPPLGTVTWGANGAFTYAPPQGFSGFDEFTYRVFQIATGIGDTAVVRIRTNAPPVAVDDAYTVDEDSVTVVTPSVLANDSDPDLGDIVRTSGNGINDYYASMSWSSNTSPTVTQVSTRLNFYGTRRLFYGITDGIDTDLGEVVVTVRPIPDAPRANLDSYLTQRDSPLTVSDPLLGVMRNDFDPDAREGAGSAPWPTAQPIDLEPLVLQLLNQPANGTVQLNPDGTFVYTPNTGYSGLDEFRYQLTDATGRISEPGRVQIRVNTPPTATNDSYSLNEDTVMIVPRAQGLLTNDSDIDGDTLTSFWASTQPCGPCRGRVTVRGDGGFTFTPDLNYFGTDQFRYFAGDPFRANAIGRVDLTILPVNDAPISEPDSYRIDEDTPLIAAEPQGLLRNDEEVDGETLVGAIVVRQPTKGAVALQGNGGLTFTPNADVNGRDTFRYRVFDESGLFDENEVEVLIDAVNDSPQANNDSYSIDQDTTLSVTAASGVLSNDSDIDGPALSVTVVSPTTHGALTLQPSGAFTYAPNGIFSGIDQFQYQVSDGLGGVAAATSTINVRDVANPVEINVTDDVYAVEGPSLTIAAPGVLGNDTVTGAPSLTAALVTAPAHGTVSVAADGGFSYTAPANFVGSTTFTYSASASGASELGLVTLNVNNVGNQPPVAVGEQFGVLEDGVLDSSAAGGLLVNDDDPEGAILTLVIVDPPQHGQLDSQANGQFVYTPAANYHGADQFRYRVSDGALTSNLVTAAITVFAQNDAPVAAADAYQVLRDQTLSVLAPGVLGNDSDVDGDALLVEIVDAPLRGQLTMAANGGFSYQPLPGLSGQDTFRYAVTDGSARALTTVSIQITVPGNRPPAAQGEAYTLAEDGTLQSGGSVARLTANDSDPDGDPLLVQVLTAPEHGELLIDGNDFSYRPDQDYAGSDSFTYRVTDGALTSPVVTTQLTITPVNDPPHANPDLYLTTQGSALTATAANGVLANDVDVDSVSLSASVVTPPAHGTLTLQSNGAFVYSPVAAYFGRDEFVYRISDGAAETTGRAAIDITASPNQRPIAVGESFVIAEDATLDTTALESLLANDTDPEGQALSLRIVVPPQRGTLTQLNAGHIRFVPQRDDTGIVSFDYVVNDGVLDSQPARVQIQLTPVNDAPVAVPDAFSLAATAPSLVIGAAQGVLTNDGDADGDTLIATVVQAPGSGTLTLGLDGSFTYTPGTPRPPQVTFSYLARDPAGLASSAVVTINLGGAAVDDVFRNGFEGTP